MKNFYVSDEHNFKLYVPVHGTYQPNVWVNGFQIFKMSTIFSDFQDVININLKAKVIIIPPCFAWSILHFIFTGCDARWTWGHWRFTKRKIAAPLLSFGQRNVSNVTNLGEETSCSRFLSLAQRQTRSGCCFHHGHHFQISNHYSLTAVFHSFQPSFRLCLNRSLFS